VVVSIKNLSRKNNSILGKNGIKIKILKYFLGKILGLKCYKNHFMTDYIDIIKNVKL